MSNSEFAVLSLIAERPSHGYEVERLIEERGMREWTEIGFSSIYYLLNKLEKKGLLSSQLEQQVGRGPARKVYHITDNGRLAYQNATLNALATPHRANAPFLSGLANLPGVSIDNALTALKQHHDELTKQLTIVQERRETQRPLPDFIEAMFDYSITMLSAEIEWLERFSQQLEANNV